MFADGFKDKRGKGIHSAYETAMVDHQAPAILAGYHAKLPATPMPPFVANGHGAAVETVALMDRAAAAVDIVALIELYAQEGGGKSKKVTQKLFDQFGDGTIQTMCDGTKVLAMIWESAWRVAGGEQKFANADIKAINKNSLRARYEKTDFVESFDLDHIKPVLKGHP